MFVVTRRSALPHLSLVSGAVVRLHADRLTLWPVSTTQKIELSVEPLPDGGYGILATTDSHATLLARYPAQRHARHQLHRLTGVGEWHWRRLLGRAVPRIARQAARSEVRLVPKERRPRRSPSP